MRQDENEGPKLYWCNKCGIGYTNAAEGGACYICDGELRSKRTVTQGPAQLSK